MGRWDVRRWFRPTLWIMVGVMLLGAAVTSFAEPAPTEEELLREADLGEDLYIGVSGREPGVSWYDKTTGGWSGFDIDMARMIAAKLDFRPEHVVYCKVKVEDRGRGASTDEACADRVLDLVIAAFSITDERAEILFAGPYLQTTSSVLTRNGHLQINTLGDLKGEAVCVAGTATSQGPLSRAGAAVRILGDTDQCVEELLAGRVAAVSSDTAILAGFLKLHPGKLINHDISSDDDEEWGVNVLGNEPLRTLVDLVFERSRTCASDHNWEDAYQRWFGGDARTRTGQQVAQPLQPKVVQKPQVRQWPWRGC